MAREGWLDFNNDTHIRLYHFILRTRRRRFVPLATQIQEMT